MGLKQQIEANQKVEELQRQVTFLAHRVEELSSVVRLLQHNSEKKKPGRPKKLQDVDVAREYG